MRVDGKQRGVIVMDDVDTLECLGLRPYGGAEPGRPDHRHASQT
jgi:hypothetical protein